MLSGMETLGIGVCLEKNQRKGKKQVNINE
jgi:hypothetical protein